MYPIFNERCTHHLSSFLFHLCPRIGAHYLTPNIRTEFPDVKRFQKIIDFSVGCARKRCFRDDSPVGTARL
jgi:hypothetical protein